ncbi:magnesium transporter CorA family protein [soil metagenome]
MSAAQTRVYRNGVLEAEGFPVAEVSEYLAQPDTVVWVDFCGPSIEQLHELALELGLHELAVEDAVSEHQRPKLDHYESHLSLSSHAVRVDTEQSTLIETEIDAFISGRWLITVRKNEAFSMGPVLRRWDRSGDLCKYGVSFLLYGLLDLIVDGYFETVQCFDDYYDEVSEGIFSEHPLNPAQQRHWFEMRQALVRFHRLVVPMREAVSALMRREHSAVSEALYPYFQDVYDHILRVSESTDALRDLVSTIVETNLSLRDYRQNQVMKKVTSWAAIIAVPTLITGYYGMNVPYPGSGTHWCVELSGALVVVLSTGLYLLFRKRE